MTSGAQSVSGMKPARMRVFSGRSEPTNMLSLWCVVPAQARMTYWCSQQVLHVENPLRHLGQLQVLVHRPAAQLLVSLLLGPAAPGPQHAIVALHQLAVVPLAA